MRRLLLCTDLDRTLIANGAQTAAKGALALFRQLVRREDVTLAYVSGRHRALIERAMFDFDLPEPAFVIADVGSTIYQVLPSGWQKNEVWCAQIAPDWHGLTHDDLCRLLAVFPVLQPQPREQQNRHKLSYHVAPEVDAAKLMGEMDACLTGAHIRANLIWSIDEPGGLGLLDVLPASANKLHAIRFLMQQSGFPERDVIFAGDSGNDLEVLLSGLPSVLVANADPQVKSQTAAANPDTLYLAQGGYLGMNGNYSAGILEGVAHYHPALDVWLRAQQLKFLGDH
ncbi:HAD family hydrolase [Rhodoferax sp.]|uniref:HAD family hydrolase n=1 Tax=Rhodoferax sp. TaxID=50421 RepID=UPI0008AD5A82|nr:HAD family hydrolase [Rhodoferax sp.]MDO8319636.1 HAD family hydrolase [Rhodoferax sp.]OGB52244.1 MAG: haloacid dehalogenase [Burkholderiales bacterium RIFOXYD12_FULL_59_19]OGB81324.1 MAG: haloacid dehalogenase [Burkholderiales bacterium RIFOXYC12_FULL_60_6]